MKRVIIDWYVIIDNSDCEYFVFHDPNICWLKMSYTHKDSDVDTILHWGETPKVNRYPCPTAHDATWVGWLDCGVKLNFPNSFRIYLVRKIE